MAGADRVRGPADPDADRVAELERRVRELEEANRSLLRTNRRLASERLMALDSAAASVTPKLVAAERELERTRSSLSWRLTAPFRAPAILLRALLRRMRPTLRAIAHRLMR
ncbi:MAG TPA: hypothetical protein VK326_05725 [Solirubrobacterales bacterium]|nr:hypothetical protein [Solirubrobacterales bacterium]